MIENLLNNQCDVYFGSTLNEYSEIVAGTPTRVRCRIGSATVGFKDTQGNSSIYDMCLHVLPEANIKRGNLIGIEGLFYVVKETIKTRDVNGNAILIFAYLTETNYINA